MNVLEFKKLYDKKYSKILRLFEYPGSYSVKETNKIVEDFTRFVNARVYIIYKVKK